MNNNLTLPTSKHNIRGFSIIELMIAMVIATILLAGTAGLFISNKRIYKEQDESAILQENGRFAIKLLYDSIRIAGYTGCNNNTTEIYNHAAPSGQQGHLGKVFNRFENAEAVYDVGHSLEGFEEGVNLTWAPSGTNDQIANITAGTDSITVRYFRDTGLVIEDGQGMNFRSDPIDLDDAADLGTIAVGSEVAVSNCTRGDIFLVTGISANNQLAHTQVGGNDDDNLSAAYAAGSEVSEVFERRFYIGDNGGEPALFCTGNDNLCNGTVMLVEGVEDMQILYEISYDDGEEREGVELDDSDVDLVTLDMLRLYRGAGTTEDATNDELDKFGNVKTYDWDRVIGVKLALLLRTPTQSSAAANDNTYFLLDKSFTAPGDQFRRRVFTTHVYIRNRRT